jgi:nucleolar complex protein 3
MQRGRSGRRDLQPHTRWMSKGAPAHPPPLPAPQCPPGESMGAAALLLRLARRYPRLASLLEWEGGAPVGGRAYDPGAADPSDAGATASALWDLTLAARHYHPHVASAARALLALTPGTGGGGGGGDGEGGGSSGGAAAGGGLLGGAAGPQELALAYDGVTRKGRFRPPPQAPRGGGAGQQLGKRARAALAAAGAAPLCGELQEAIAAGAAGPSGGSGSSGGKGGRKRGRQQAAAAAAAREAAAAVAAAQALDGGGDGGSSGGDADGVEAAAQRQWESSRRFARNAALRLEAALLAAKVGRFRERLMDAAAAAAAGGGGGAGAAAPAPDERGGSGGGAAKKRRN